MRIFLSFLQGNPNHPIPGYSFWEYYIKNGITEAGYTFFEENDIDWALGLVPQSKQSLQNWKANVWQRTIDFIKKQQIDVFLSYLYPQQIDEQAIKEIQKLGIYCVNFFCDNVRQFKVIPNEFRVFDLNWVPEYKALPMYEKAKIPYIHLPMPMWVDPKYRNCIIEENNQLSFIGSRDIQRQILFEEFAAKHIDINIYGAGWNDKDVINNSKVNNNILIKLYNQFDFIKNYGFAAYENKLTSKKFESEISPVLQTLTKYKPTFSEYIDITRNSMITIGVNRYPSFDHPILKPNTYSRLRDIEAPMLGACYLTEWTDGLSNMYEIDKEIFTYSNVDELKYKLDELKDNKQKRLLARKIGQLKAISTLSIPNSLQKIKTIVGHVR